MVNPLLDVPFNTKKIFVRAAINVINNTNKCMVYMPVDSNDRAVQIKKRNELYLQLNSKLPSLAS